MKNIYVGNLPRTVTEDSLKAAFEQYGQVSSVKIIKDKFTGEVRGFGFITMPVDDEAQEAINSMNGYDLGGQKLRVNEAREPEMRSPRPSSGGSRFGGPSDRSGSRGGNGGGFRSNRY